MVLRLSQLGSCRSGRYQTCLRSVISYRGSRAPFMSSAVRAAVTMDQTKKSNDPSQDLKEGHHDQATKTASEGDRSHPAKQPDPQPSPSKSTGVRSEGPGSKSGEGTDHGVHKGKGAGAGQHTG